MTENIRRALARLVVTVRKIFLLPVFIYRRYISPLKLSPSCRFTPTCSQYAVEAVMEWGIVIGSALSLWRLIRCNPFSKGGEDKVPQNPLHRRN